MTREERIERVRATIDTAADRSKHWGSPCAKCRHSRGMSYSYSRKCKSPVAALENMTTRSTGAVEISWPSPNNMRAPSGLCGPEGLLFERRWPWHFLLFWRNAYDWQMFAFGVPIMSIGAILLAIAFVSILVRL